MSSLTDNKFTYKGNVPKVKYVLTEIEKAALKEVGRFVTKEAKNNLSEVTEKRTGLLKRSIGYWVKRKDKSVQVGVRKKAFYGLFIEKGHRILPKGFYINKRGLMAQKGTKKLTGGEGQKRRYRASTVEFGGNTVPARPFLTPAAQDNIPEIRKIVGQYMAELSKENVTVKTGGDEGSITRQ